MLEQIADLDAKSISPETARDLLELSISRSHQNQVDVLSQKAREGSLTPAEQADLDEFIRVADLLAILQSVRPPSRQSPRRARERRSVSAAWVELRFETAAASTLA